MMTSSKRIYVLDTNVLMHDPTALFRFEEHDVYLPMMVLEELDNGKKGHSEASRNARQVSRFLNEIIEAHGNGDIDQGVRLVRPQGLQLRAAEAVGRLLFQLKPVEVGKRFGTVLPDNQILGSILQLIEDHPGVPVGDRAGPPRARLHPRTRAAAGGGVEDGMGLDPTHPGDAGRRRGPVRRRDHPRGGRTPVAPRESPQARPEGTHRHGRPDP